VSHRHTWHAMHFIITANFIRICFVPKIFMKYYTNSAVAMEATTEPNGKDIYVHLTKILVQLYRPTNSFCRKTTTSSSSSSLFGMHHQCVAPLAANSLHSSLFRASSIASFKVWLCRARSFFRGSPVISATRHLGDIRVGDKPTHRQPTRRHESVNSATTYFV